MINLRKAIQIALYGTVLVGAGSTSAAVDVVENGGAEQPPLPNCTDLPAYWNRDGYEGGSRVLYEPPANCGGQTAAAVPAWVDTWPPFEGEDWMFYTGPRNAPGGSNVSRMYQNISIPGAIRPANDGGLCMDWSAFPELDQGFWVSGWFSTKCQDGVEGAAGIGISCAPQPEDYGRVSVAANGNPRCTSGNLQSERWPYQPATWEELAPDTCSDGLEGGGPGSKTYRLTLEGYDSPDPGIRPDVVWDNVGLHVQCTGAAASMGGRTYDSPSKPNGKQKPVRAYGGMGFAEWDDGWDGAEGFAVKANFTITYQKTPGGQPLRDTCHLQADENTYVRVFGSDPNQGATFAGLAMWCNQSGCEDSDVMLTLYEYPERGRVMLAGASCIDHDFPLAPVDAGHVMVDGVPGHDFGMDTD